MKTIALLSIILLMNLFFLKTSSHHIVEQNCTQIEERLGGPKFPKLSNAFQRLTESDIYKTSLPRFISKVGKASKIPIVAVKYREKTALQIAKEIGDVVMPIIQWGLALLAWPGALVGGIVAGVWGLMAPLFGKTQMEQMIYDIKDELENMRTQVKEIADKIREPMMKEIHEKIGEIVKTGINGEADRNQYICNKYLISDKKVMNNSNRPIDDTLRYEWISHMSDCDNFLKDSAEAYLYVDYANILWPPAVYTTFVRIGFLADFCNHGELVKLDVGLIDSMSEEKRHEIKKMFIFADTAVYKRLDTLVGWNRDRITLNFTGIEYEACNIQSLILYLEKEMYPNGIPDFVQISNEDIDVNLADYNVTEESGQHHIQIYYNMKGNAECDDGDSYVTIFNCINGRSVINRVSLQRMSFRVTFVPNKFYQIRVLYFMRKSMYTQNAKYDGLMIERKELTEMERNIVVIQESNNTFKIYIRRGKLNNDSAERFLIQTGMHVLHCNTFSKIGSAPAENCVSAQVGYSGDYVIENVYAFNVKSHAETWKIDIERTYDHDSGSLGDTIILGAEILIKPAVVKDGHDD